MEGGVEGTGIEVGPADGENTGRCVGASGEEVFPMDAILGDVHASPRKSRH